MHLTSIIANIIKIFFITHVSNFFFRNTERSRRNWFVIICT
jgi:hypothetical protein